MNGVMELRPGLTKKTTRTGKGDQPQPGQQVTVHYTGTLEDGRVFDSSRERGQPLKFVIGTSQVILGWDLGIAAMKVGESAVITIPPEYGYGNSAAGPIPPGSTLIFEVELMAASDIQPETTSCFIYGLGVLSLLIVGVILYFIPTITKALANMASGRHPGT
mmetsp:Transcript_807/g.2887  ORF Transcript_807/g.2887 Transcript_807/m.2887 type:complete len:162 (+) Transcript_807:170-655(+)|eukprot:scaffold280346_cov31-Tisochrysis_lutea.AAC.2